VFNYLIGSLLRIFTTLQEVDDKLILYSFVAAFALNLILAAQMLYFWKAPAPPQVQKIQDKKAEKMTGVQVPAAKSSAVSAGQSGKGPKTRRRG
jgi:mannose-P-dolichol utilization defect protein 1